MRTTPTSHGTGSSPAQVDRLDPDSQELAPSVRHVVAVIVEVSVSLVLNDETKPDVMTWVC